MNTLIYFLMEMSPFSCGCLVGAAYVYLAYYRKLTDMQGYWLQKFEDNTQFLQQLLKEEQTHGAKSDGFNISVLP